VEYYSQVGWVDDYVKNIAPYIHVRRQDALLIKIPNEAYKLNAQAMDVLRHILDGGSVYDIVNAYPEREKVAADIHHFFATCGQYSKAAIMSRSRAARLKKYRCSAV
jgi:hypothetical protein